MRETYASEAIARFAQALQGHDTLEAFSEGTLAELVATLDAHAGAVYIVEAPSDATRLRCLARYATTSDSAPEFIVLGEGLIGQVARDGKGRSLDPIPTEYMQIRSGTAHAPAGGVLLEAIRFEERTLGVVELARIGSFTEQARGLFAQLVALMGIVIVGIRSRRRTEELLEAAQSMAARLEAQQHELRATNEQLTDQARLVGHQRDELKRKNEQLEGARSELEHRAEQLSLSSRYKSQFLANMSHELRTPLNALLILSNLLARNSEGRLSPKEVEFARTIHESGTDLLQLIDQILDLAKIESGTTELTVATVATGALAAQMERNFRPMAEERALQFSLSVEDGVAPELHTDVARLKQILRNLLSNAVKFTEDGGVTLTVRRAAFDEVVGLPDLTKATDIVAFEVADTGIGIAPEKHRLVFQAFQQADGSITRRFGGTGLGLAISKEIATVLGGVLTLESQAGQGATFTLYIPAVHLKAATAPQVEIAEATPPAIASDEPSEAPSPDVGQVLGDSDDREEIEPGDRILLIVDDDHGFARTLMTVARAHQFRCLLAGSAREALSLARTFRPDAITLDIGLPDGDGVDVLKQLKDHPRTRAIPVHVLTGRASRDRALAAGASTAAIKPVSSAQLESVLDDVHAHIDGRLSRILVVEDSAASRDAIVQMLAEANLSADAVAEASEAIRYLDSYDYDCLILDLVLPDMPGAEVIAAIRGRPALRRLPIIVYTGRVLSSAEASALRGATASIISKGLASADRLLVEVARHTRRSARRVQPVEPGQTLDGIRALIVDDDMRNVFALTALLEAAGAQVEFAENGRDGLERVLSGEPVDVVLMDVMMPDMDGYEASRQIRADTRFSTLPILAVTARSMPLDRERCIAAGMNDHIAKPVDDAQLLAVIHRWTSTD